MRLLPGRSFLASPRFTPRELIRCTASAEGLDLCVAGFRRVSWKDFLAVAVVAVGRPMPKNNLFLLLRDQLRPFRVPEHAIDLAAFGIEEKESTEKAFRALLIEFDRRQEMLAIPEETAAFLRGGPVPVVTEIELAALTTNWMAGLYPRLGEELAPAPVTKDPEDNTSESLRNPVGGRRSAVGPASPTVFGPASPVGPPPLLPPIDQQIPFGAQRLKAVLAGLPDRLPVDRRDLRRILATWSLAGVATLLPVAYLTVIFGLLFRVYRYASEDGLALFAVGEEGRWTLEIGDFFFVCPVGLLLLVLIAFVEPLFVGRRINRRATALSREREPVMRSLIDRVADLVRAEAPQVVEVTCDASLIAGRRKIGSSKQQVLSLGLPMVAGLSGRQLAALLASELVAFRRRSDRHPLGWICRIDEELADLGTRCEDLQNKRREGVGELVRKLGLGIFVDGLLLMIFGLVRGVVFCLVFLSGLIRSRVERLVVEEGREVGRRLEGAGAFRHLETWAEELRSAQLETLFEGLSGRGGLPSDHLPARGVLRALEIRAADGGSDKAPYRAIAATALFKDFGGLSRQVTRDLLRNEAGGVAATEAVEDQVRKMSGEEAESEALGRFFAATLLSWRPLPLASTWAEDPRPDDQLVESLALLRRSFVENAEKHRTLLASYDRALAVRISARRGAELMHLGLDLDPKSFGLAAWNPDVARDQIQRATDDLRRLGSAVQSFEVRSGQRMMAALALVSSPSRAARLEGAEEREAEVGKLLEGLGEISKVFSVWVRLREELTVLGGVEGSVRGQSVQVDLAKLRAETWRDRWIEPSRVLQQRLAGLPDYFHAGGLDFSTVIAGLPVDEWGSARDTVVRVRYFVLRAMGRLAVLAERIELAAGFEPLPPASPFVEENPLPGRYQRTGQETW